MSEMLVLFPVVVIGVFVGVFVARPLAEAVYRLRYGKKMTY